MVTHSKVVESSTLPGHYSAKAAELVALTRHFELAKDSSVTIYTDSHYVFGMVHDFGIRWQHCGFLTMAGKPIYQ